MLGDEDCRVIAHHRLPDKGSGPDESLGSDPGKWLGVLCEVLKTVDAVAVCFLW